MAASSWMSNVCLSTELRSASLESGFFFYEVCYREHQEGRGGVQKTFVMRQYTREEDTAGICDLLLREASAL